MSSRLSENRLKWETTTVLRETLRRYGYSCDGKPHTVRLIGGVLSCSPNPGLNTEIKGVKNRGGHAACYQRLAPDVELP